MNEDTVKGEWKQLSGKIKQKWGKFTDDDLMRAEGSKDYLFGKLQEYYGLAKDKAEQGLHDLGYHRHCPAHCTDSVSGAGRGIGSGSAPRTGG